MLGRKHAAGCVVLAADTGRILLAHRSSLVLQPNTWGIWGGAIGRRETPIHGALREFHEETGYRGRITRVVPLLVFIRRGFTYHNFLAVVPSEFEPDLNWESQGAAWHPIDAWPTPLHPGVAALFADTASRATIAGAVKGIRDSESAPLEYSSALQ